MGCILFVALVGLLSRLWYLQIAHGDQYSQMAQVNRIRLLKRPAPRGDIVDCAGHVLAASRSRYAIYAEPSVEHDPLVLKRLATLLGATSNDIAIAIAASKKNDYDLVQVALDVPIAVVTQIEEQRPYLPGISTAPEAVRWYPNGDRLGNVLGTVGRIDPEEVKANLSGGYSPNDFIGKTGLEEEYEQELRGTPGGTRVEIDAQGRMVRRVGDVDPIQGHTLELAVNDRVEAAAEQVFAEHHWTGAAAAVDPRTGAVIALTSSPSFDPNLFSSGISVANWNRLDSDPRKPMLNRAVDALYPPGSTFKQVVAAAGLQCGAVTTNTSIYCTGVFKLGRSKIHDWEVHGEVDFERAIAVSCDVYFYQLGLKMGADTLARYASQYPLAQKTGIDLPHESIGSMPSPEWKEKHFERLGPKYEEWFGGDTLNTSIGQGYVLVTPLQMALVTAATANGGYVLRPYLVSRILDSRTHAPVQVTQTVILRRVPIDPEYLSDVRDGMRECVTNGTGAVVDLPSVAVGAKTGSAQFGTGPTHGWFVAFAPFDHPTIACAAVVEHGGHGGTSAGEVVRAMLEAYFNLQDTGERRVRTD
jgi:penicillin-binding protein 2